MRFFIIPVLMCFLASQAIAANFDAIAEEEPAKAAPAAKNDGDCADDPRLVTDIVEIMEADNPQIRPLMKITPETYVSMDNDLREKMKGNAVICPNVSVLKNGSHSGSIAIDFPTLWTQVKAAAAKKDVERMKWLLSNFKSKPLPPEDILNLVTKTGIDREAGEALYEIINQEPGNFPSVIDFFVFTGGRTSEPAVVYIAFPADQHEDLRKETEKGQKVIFSEDLCRHIAAKRGSVSAFSDKLRATGLSAKSK